MQESAFTPIREEITRKKQRSEEPRTAEERDEAGERPMNLTDYWLSLRLSVQEKIKPDVLATEDRERIKLMNELITPELMREYKDILKEFAKKAGATPDHPKREYIDVENEEMRFVIQQWIEKLLNEVKGKRELGLSDDEIDELRAQCWMFFDAAGNVMNTRSLEKDIRQFDAERKVDEMTDTQKDAARAELVTDLQSRFPLSKDEIEILIGLIETKQGNEEPYSPKLLVETLMRLWDEYGLGKQKKAIAGISLGHLLGEGARSFAPSMFQNLMTGDRLNVAVFLEYLGLNEVSRLVDSKTRIELARVMKDVNSAINERITDSLFFQEFEFIHEKSLGEVFATLERGKESTERLIEDTISQFAPMLAGIGMSLAFLTKINPILGAVGLGGMPVMYYISKRQNAKISPMYERERREGEKIATRIGTIKSGFEEVKTSPESPAIARHVREQLDTKDALSIARYIEMIKTDYLRFIPFTVSEAVAACVGGVLQQTGAISGGEVLANVIYTGRLNEPVQRLVELYFDRFARYIQDIQRMDEILGKYEELDLPEGEKEKERVPVSQLKDHSISIRGLRYKNILSGVNLDVPQGEFLSIAGASGAGKSTLLRNMVGLYRPDGGSVAMGGVPIDRVKRYGKESLYSVMSYCNQTPQLFEAMTLRENLVLWSREAVDDARIRQILSDLDLEKFADHLDEEVKHVSGGERVRIGLARTLIKGAKVMLLDEPTSSLDSQAATEVIRIIREIHVKYPETTIICVSHDEALLGASDRSVNVKDL